MAEKTGHLEKIVFDFNTAGVLEISSDNEKWYRVTASRFRSWDGPRRITEPTIVVRANPRVPMRTYVYEGPVYFSESNRVATKQNNFTVRYI